MDAMEDDLDTSKKEDTVNDFTGDNYNNDETGEIRLKHGIDME